MPKSVLHEFCQSQKMSLPQYETEASYDGNALLGFHCVLFVKDEYFTTDRLYTNKREAEHAVARKGLNVFGYYARSPLYTGSTPTHQPQGTPSFKTPETSYKNLLQEHLQQRNIETPSYETQLTGKAVMHLSASLGVDPRDTLGVSLSYGVSRGFDPWGSQRCVWMGLVLKLRMNYCGLIR